MRQQQWQFIESLRFKLRRPSQRKRNFNSGWLPTTKYRRFSRAISGVKYSLQRNGRWLRGRVILGSKVEVGYPPFVGRNEVLTFFQVASDMSQWSSTKARQVLAALLRIGWTVKRTSGSHRTLERSGWQDYVFAFHDGDEIGPQMLARIARKTGLKPGDI